MSTNGGTARDAAARRRRIAERGSERLAFITGRVQSTSSSPLPPPVVESHNSLTTPCPSISRNTDQLPLSDENTDSSLNTEIAGHDIGSDVRPLKHDTEAITETSTQTSFEPSKIQSFPTTLTEQNPPISTQNKSQKSQLKTYPLKSLTPNRLRPAIAASEDIRRNCSVITALLVLLSYAGFPILGSNIIKSIILSRPLALLILTNITIVAAPVVLGKVEQKEHRGSSTGEMGLANHLGAVFEWSMLTKTGLSALFMDCSVYSVVVICGMSILQKLGW